MGPVTEPLDLAPVEAMYTDTDGSVDWHADPWEAMSWIPALVAEVKRLRTEESVTRVALAAAMRMLDQFDPVVTAARTLRAALPGVLVAGMVVPAPGQIVAHLNTLASTVDALDGTNRSEETPAGDRLATVPRYPCAACGRPILVFNDSQGRPSLLYDPEPGDGPYFDAVLSKDGTRIAGSGRATAQDCRGRFPLYRAHFFSCPERLIVPDRAESEA